MTKVKLLTLDVPNKNGRTYPKAVVQAALDRWRQEGESLLIMPRPAAADGQLRLADAVGTAKEVTVENDSAIAACEMLSPELEALLAEGRLAVVPVGVGSVNKAGVVQEDYSMSYLLLTDDPAT